MAEIAAFRGIRYDRDRVGDLGAVLTPPFDVIDEEAQTRFYRLHPYNIIRLELGRVLPGDSERDNRYTRAARTLARWLEEGALRPDDRPAIYLHEEEFSLQGERRVRTSFLSRVKLADYARGQVLPHEDTLAKPLEDRIRLLRACRTNFSPIHGLYSDPLGAVADALRAGAGATPTLEFTDTDGSRHRLWLVTAEQAIKKTVELMKPRTIYIADGHHRYETARRFRDEMKHRGEPGDHEYVLMALTNLYDPGLVILPTHRLVRDIPAARLIVLKERLASTFTVREIPLHEGGSPGDAGTQAGLEECLDVLRREGERVPAIGMYTGNQTFYLLRPRDESVLERYAPDRSPAYRRLSASLLQTAVLEGILGIGDRATREGDNLTYTHDAHEAIAGVRSGTYQVAFLLNPTRVLEVKAVAAAGDRMPQKSTYFYPKVRTGIVLNPLYRI